MSKRVSKVDQWWELVALNHVTTVSAAVEAFMREHKQQQQMVEVLLVLDYFGIATTDNLLSVEALCLFYELLSTFDRD